MKNKKRWFIFIVITIALITASFIFRDEILGLINTQAASIVANNANSGNALALASDTTLIRSAADSAQVSAAGNIAVGREQPVIFQVEGTVVEVVVEVGDEVSAGDYLIALDTTDLARAVTQAELSLAESQLQLDILREPADPAAIAAAQASLASAEENLLEVRAGPSAAELAAAEASLAAAQTSYQELLAGPTEAELIQLKAELQKAEITLRQAQGAYDQIAYADNVGASSQAAELQEATIDYESAKAALDEASAPATPSELQDALSAIQTAQNELETLRNQPTAADLAAAEAQVASSAAALASLLAAPTEAELREAQISVEQATLSLAEAQAELAKAQLLAPIDGTILSMAVSAGEQVSSGASALTMADLTQLKLTVNVAEVDVSQLQIGQPAEITLDALPEQVFQGVVTQIAPASDSEEGVVNYPVTIQLTDPDPSTSLRTSLSGVRPGMTAMATIVDDDAEEGWLVPTAALQERSGQTVVLIMRDGQPTPIAVTVRGLQGEWSVVHSPDLQAGDEAVGSVSSFLDEDDSAGGFGPPPGGGF